MMFQQAFQSEISSKGSSGHNNSSGYCFVA